MLNALKRYTRQLGPGFLIAATGVGAGDMVAATVGGARFGMVILWASVLGAVLKYILNEGIARWQIANGTTLIRGWTSHFHQAVSIYFFTYLVVWTFIVAGALMASCGLAAHAFFPQLPISWWGIIHSILAVILVLGGRYSLLEQLMKIFIALMFITVITNLFMIDISWSKFIDGILIPKVPDGGTQLVLGIIGGVGGSVTLLCYGYWLKEKGWTTSSIISTARTDLVTAYSLTGLFGVAIIVLAAQVNPEVVTGNKIVLALGKKLEETTGSWGKWIFMVGFWGAVFSSMLGVWSGVPYLFNDHIHALRQKRKKSENKEPNTKSGLYRYYLYFMAFPPMALLFLEKPVWIIILYAVAGAFFMPFLAIMLLWMNNTVKWVGKLKNGIVTNVLLILTLILFGYLMITKVVEYF